MLPTPKPEAGTTQPKKTPTAFEHMDTPTATNYALANNGKARQDNGTALETTRSRIAVEVTIDDKRIEEVLSVHITQTLGGHHRLEMRFYQDQVQATGTMLIDGAEKLLGKVTEVELYDKNGSATERLQQLFVIADVQFEHQALNEGILHLTGYAPTWLLDGAPHFEIFYKKSLSTIAQSVSRPLSQVKASINAAPTLGDTLPFVCRYNESAWNFLKRLSVETGQWLYFNGKELIFGRPEARHGGTITYGNNCSRLTMSLQAHPVQQQLYDYDASGHQSLQTAADSYSGNAGAYNLMGLKRSTELFGTEPSAAGPAFLPSSAAMLEDLGKHKGAQKASEMYYVKGESTAHNLRVGLNVDVELSRLGEKASHAPIRITQVTHSWEVTGKYHNSFEGIPVGAEVPPSLAYQRPTTYPVLAEVIDNDDGQGRVRVQFMGWQQEGRAETDFIRVLSPDAGNSDVVGQNRGYVFIPEVGDQVYVDFEFGNPDRPFVTGSVFHGRNGAGGGGGNHTKSIITRSGHTIELDDTANGTHIIIKDPGGNEIYLDTQGKNITITAPETMTFNARNMNINVTENMNTSVGMNNSQSIGMNNQLSVGANNTTSVGMMNDTIIGGNNLMMVTGDFSELIEGDLISEAKKDRTEVSEQGIDISSKGSIINNAAEEVQLNSSGNSKAN